MLVVETKDNSNNNLVRDNKTMKVEIKINNNDIDINNINRNNELTYKF